MRPSWLTAMDSLSWGGHQEVSTDVSAGLGWKCSANSITWSQLFSSPIWWSTQQERESGFIEWTREKLNPASQRDQQACWWFRFWDVLKYVRFLWSFRISTMCLVPFFKSSDNQ